MRDANHQIEPSQPAPARAKSLADDSFNPISLMCLRNRPLAHDQTETRSLHFIRNRNES